VSLRKPPSRERYGLPLLGSGPPVPRRRPFASGILPVAHSDAAGASPSWLRLAAYAGSRGTGSPSLSSGLQEAAIACAMRTVVRLTPLRFREAREAAIACAMRTVVRLTPLRFREAREAAGA
jgi:hypothetical protein